MNLFEQIYNELLLEDALWVSETAREHADGEFEDQLIKMYEFEYKLHAIDNWNFNGIPQRYQNIENIYDTN